MFLQICTYIEKLKYLTIFSTMEPVFDLVKLREELRMDYRKRLDGITPSIIVSMGIEPSIEKLE